MPIYEYQCSACGHYMEKFQKISDAPLTTCPACHQETMNKLVSAAAFKLKGSGWYETDFKDKKPKTESKAAGNSTASKKTDNNSAAKTPTKPSSTSSSSND